MKGIASLRPRKIQMILLLLFLVPTIAISLAFSRIIRQDVLRAASELYSNFLEQNSYHIDEVIDRIQVSGSTLQLNRNVQAFFRMREAPSSYEDYKTLKKVYSELQYCVELSEGILKDICIYNSSNGLLRSVSGVFSYDSEALQSQPEWEELFSREFCMYTNSNFVQLLARTRNATVMVRGIVSNGLPQGFVALILDDENFGNLFRMEKDASEAALYLISADGQTMVPAQNSAPADIPLAELRSEKNTGGNLVRSGDVDYLCMRRESQILNRFEYLLIIPLKKLEHSMTAHITYYSGILYLILFVVILCSVKFASMGIYTPINTLRNRLSGNGHRKKARVSLIEREVMADIEQMIDDMHSQIQQASNTIAFIRTENEALKNDLCDHERKLNTLPIRKLLNQETLTHEEEKYLLSGLSEDLLGGFCVVIIRDMDELESPGQILECYNRLCAGQVAQDAACRFLCAINFDLYFLICMRDAEVWPREKNGFLDLFRSVIDALRQESREVCIIVGDPSFSPQNALMESFASAKKKMRYSYMLPQPDLLADIDSKEILFPLQYELFRRFEDALQRDKLDTAIVVMEEFNGFLACHSMSIAVCFIFQQSMLYVLLNFVLRRGRFQEMIDELFPKVMDFGDCFKNYQEANEYILEQLNRLRTLEWNRVMANHATQAMYILEDEGYQDIRLQEIAGRLGISEAHLSRQFKATYGVNFKEYLIHMKLRRAKEMLSNDSCTLREICDCIGYEDVKQFSRIFKKYEGMTPLQYRISRKI